MQQAHSSAQSGRHIFTTVQVLLLRWEHEDLGLSEEVAELGNVFRCDYAFEVIDWEIPCSKSPTRALNQKIEELLGRHDQNDNLFIVYYAGHGLMDHDRQLIWTR